MNLDNRRQKASCLERSLSKLQAADYEMVIEGCMLAGTHWFNIVLHGQGVLPPEQDAMHAEFMSVADRRKVRLLAAAALDAMDTIEDLRISHVRGDMPYGENAAERALECLQVLREEAKARINAMDLAGQRDPASTRRTPPLSGQTEHWIP